MINICDKLDVMIPNPKCELEYSKDYELLIATVLSAQCTDKRVNEVTKILFSKYDIFSLANATLEDISTVIKSLGSFSKKSMYVKEIAKRLVNDYNGVVPNDRYYLESLPGVGRKTCNVVLANLFDVPAIAVDTHVERVSKRLELVKMDSSVRDIEKELENIIPKDRWIRSHHQLVLFGRYICRAKNPNCDDCLFINCKHRKRK